MDKDLGVTTRCMLSAKCPRADFTFLLSGTLYLPLDSLVKLLIGGRGVINVNLEITGESVSLFMSTRDVRMQSYLMRHDKTRFCLSCNDQIA